MISKINASLYKEDLEELFAHNFDTQCLELIESSKSMIRGRKNLCYRVFRDLKTNEVWLIDAIGTLRALSGVHYEFFDRPRIIDYDQWIQKQND